MSGPIVPPSKELSAASLMARHRISRAKATQLEETCALALSARGHSSPTSATVVDVELPGETALLLEWVAPPVRSEASWDSHEITEHGAEAVAFACVDAFRGLVVVRRAPHGSRVDWYLKPPGTGASIEDAILLEVSGTDEGNLEQRYEEKCKQAASTPTGLPAIALCVRFVEPRAKMGSVVAAPLPSKPKRRRAKGRKPAR